MSMLNALALENADAQLATADLSPAARRDEVIEAWADEADRMLSSLDARAAHLVPNAEGQIRPTPLSSDPQLVEARLAAAERHTQMMLDTVPTAQLPDRLAELAGSDAYLLSATPFGRMYLASRGVKGV